MKIALRVLLVLISLPLCGQQDWEDEKLNTGKSASYLNDMEREVLLEMNKVRTDPKRYSEMYIQPLLKRFKGKLNTMNNVQTQEGVKAVKECVAVLAKTASMGPLEPEKQLSRAAAHHTELQSKTNQTGHTSPNGETFQQRIGKGRFTKIGECIAYGQATGREIVVALLVDDGVPLRGHRKLILEPLFKVAGVGAGSHQGYETMCTIDFGASELKAVKRN